VEEKALMAALADASIVSALFPPADEPLPVGPLPVAPAGRTFAVPQLVVDRHPSRQIARAVLSTCRVMRVPALSAGIAATGDRLDVASALAAHGLPRPLTALCTSEAAALEAVAASELPATLLPLDLQSSGIALLDFDAAEAIVEHRVVLGGSVAALGLIQAGAPAAADLATVAVVDGKATALTVASGTPVSDDALHLAEAAARVLNADLVSIVLALSGQQPLVWDVQPVPEFRHALPIAGQSVAQAIADAVALRLTAQIPDALMTERSATWTKLTRERIPGDVVVSA
jgi:hypothetical protein